MTTTAAKQIAIAKTSSILMRSLSMQKAMIETQNGLVYQQTMVREMGAYTAAIWMSMKLSWPKIIRAKSIPLLPWGNCFIGLVPEHSKKRRVHPKEMALRYRL